MTNFTCPKEDDELEEEDDDDDDNDGDKLLPDDELEEEDDDDDDDNDGDKLLLDDELEEEEDDDEPLFIEYNVLVDINEKIGKKRNKENFPKPFIKLFILYPP